MTNENHLLIRLDERVKSLEEKEKQRGLREWALIVAIIVALVNGFADRFTGVTIDQAAIWLFGVVF